MMEAKKKRRVTATGRQRLKITERAGDDARLRRRAMNEPEKKRKRDCQDDGSTAAEEGGGVGAARDSMMAKMRDMLEQTRSQIMVEMQGKMGAMERRSDELAKKCQSQEERCHFLEARCDSLERSVQILVKNQIWESSAPDIPDSYWEERGFGEDYIHQMVKFIRRIKNDTRRMRSGEDVEFISFGYSRGYGRDLTLLHDKALLPYWREFTDALQLCNYSGDFIMGKIQLPSSVLDMLAPALATKIVKSFRLGGNNFAGTSDGIKFAREFIQTNPHLEGFHWIDNPIDNTNQANEILKVVISHPTLNEICLDNSLGPNVNGYDALCSLVKSNKSFLEIHLRSSNITTRGRTDLPDFLATNPPLQCLDLAKNNLDNSDALLIAVALKRNTNLQYMTIGDNNITAVGRDALCSAVFDSTCFKSVADCNHTCWICGLGIDYIFEKYGHSSPNSTRARKVYSLLTERYHEGSILNNLDLEFVDDAVKFVPKLLECVYIYSGCLGPASQRPPQSLSIMFEILRGWKMPELFEGHTR